MVSTTEVLPATIPKSGATKGKRPAKPWRGGRKALLTLSEIQRVGDKVAMGLPVEYSLLLAGIKRHSWECAMARPRLYEAFQMCKARFLNEALDKIKVADARTLPVGLCWILERRHSDIFSKSTSHVNVNATFVSRELPLGDLADRARRMLTSDRVRKKLKTIDI